MSFSDYASGKTPVAESVAPAKAAIPKPAVVAPKPVAAIRKPAVAAPVAKKVIKESAFIVGNDFKVKLVLDIPQSIVNDYVAKVKKDTGKDALANFTVEEVAEEMVRYIIKTKLSIENLPAALSVGEQTQSDTEGDIGQEGEDIEFEVDDDETEEKEPTKEPVNDEDDPFKDETEEFELDDEDDDTEPVKSGDANDKMSFQATEVENVEKDSIELDADQTA